MFFWEKAYRLQFEIHWPGAGDAKSKEEEAEEAVKTRDNLRSLYGDFLKRGRKNGR